MYYKQHGIDKGILTLTLLWILTGCAYQQPLLQPEPEESPPLVEIKPETQVSLPDMLVLEIPVPAAPEPRFHQHKVRWPEETLSHIAQWYTGNMNNWKAIAEVNPELNPKTIDIGDTISIPEDLLTSRKPMPHSFVRVSAQKNKTPLSSTQKPSTSSEPPKLFGPIESGPSVNETDPAKLFGPIE